MSALHRPPLTSALLPLLGTSLLVLGGCATEIESRPPPPTRTPFSQPAPEPSPTTNTQVYVYPSNGQTPEQLDRDRYECHAWAVKQSNFDPSETRVAPHQRVRVVAMPQGSNVPAGAATGAILGAAVSRSREAGAGAVIGAASDQSRQQQVDSIQRTRDDRNSEIAASMEQQAAGYRRAIGACLEGRGYTVK